MWAIGVIILIVMMATAFMGYIKHSTKWSKFNSNSKNLLRFNNKNKKYKNIYLIQKRNYSNYTFFLRAMVIRRRDAEAGADADAETQMTD